MYNHGISYVSNYFYCCIQPEGLLYDAEHDLLAIAEFPVLHTNQMFSVSVQSVSQTV